MPRDATQGSRAQIELTTIYEVGKILSSSLDIGRTFRDALNVLVAHMGFRRGMIVLDDGEGGLKLASSIGLSPDEQLLGRYRPGEGVIGKVYASGGPIVVPDIADEPMFLNRTRALDAGTRGPIAFVAVPIRSSHGVAGVLTIDRTAGREGGFRDDLRLLTMVANLLGQAVVLHQGVSAERKHWLDETRRLKGELKGRYSIQNAVGASKLMQQVFAEVHQVGPSRSTVLLRGESGTGKEVIARAIHELSPRSGGPFVKVNCAALTETLLESELFGHEKGAFTGASGERRGRFELASGGTLFLDEIGDISPAFQAKLLRVLQEREVERVGGSRPIKVDVRLIFATNRDLEKMVAAGSFRGDLYYRINVVSICLPPLRERREDIPPLVTHFIERFNKENRRDLRLSPEALKVLYNCYWPGNVRELENCIERTATMTRGRTIEMPNFPCSSDRCLTRMLHGETQEGAAVAAPTEAAVVAPPVSRRRPDAAAAPARAASPVPGDDKPEGERERLIWAMERSGWVQAKAARLLNITPRQMAYALQKHAIEVRKF
jgi:Nif-specific regulatory protein